MAGSDPTPRATRDAFELLIDESGGRRTLRVTSFTGLERVSRPFAFDVQVFAEESEDLSSIIGTRAALTLQFEGGGARSISGVITAVRQASTSERGRGHPYSLRLSPRLKYLKLRRTSRIFQDLTVPEIVRRVAEGAGIGVDFSLDRSYAARSYCVQYRETDLGFIERLLAEEGIFYFLAHTPADKLEELGPEDRLVLGDHPNPQERAPNSRREELVLSLRRGGTAVGDNEREVERFSRRSALRTEKVLIRDYDFRRPLLDLRADTKSPESREQLLVYRHRGDFEETEVDPTRAAVDLEQERVGAMVAEGVSRCRALGVGALFTLETEEGQALADRYWVTEVRHKGVLPELGATDEPPYRNSFKCLPVAIAARPKRPRRSLDNVLATAVVVGPKNEEIHVDEFGRIKVQFHWDLEGKHDERSSIWIRLMQSWSGSGWGSQFIPRVGMEVLVSFLGGDQDCPVVMGCLPNAAHPVPFALPQNKARSGLRTHSYPGGGGFNELSFDDTAGREQVYLHAQHDLDEVVGKNHSLVVRADESLRVLGNRMEEVGKDLTQHVRSDWHRQIEGHQVDVVAGNRDERVAGMAVTRVEGREQRHIQGESQHTFATDYTTRVEGSMTTVVGKSDRKRAWTTHAEGTASLSGLDRLELSSDKELVLRVGKSAIRITAEQIEILAAAISSKGAGGSISVGDEGMTLQSKDKAKLSLDKRLLIKTESASISMEKEVKVDGSKILLNSPDSATDPKPKDPEPPTTILLKDEETGAPLAEQRYLVRLKDGTELSGRTDKDGKAELELAADGKVVFSDLKMPGDFDQKPFEPYVVRRGDYVGKLAFIHGFDEEKIWNDPKNKDLKARRKDPTLLLAGDILHFPRSVRQGEPLTKGTKNEYKAKVPKTTARFTYEDRGGPWADVEYVIQGLGAETKGKTDKNGTVVVEAPLHVREVRIAFPSKRMVFPVMIGDLDPIEEPTGLYQRLEHLGYVPTQGEVISEGDVDARLKDGLARFQKKSGLAPTGALDDATKKALHEAHGE
ncbi:MAG: type VI secretion system tip protein TssI/VgrG [Polyangiaceae bacterium]